ncbi:MAG: hypothetical protein GX446_14145 [Chthonomonadales bacterium]|nr:hypothetical protein [Chthonomonadales bacterium]
MGGVITGVPLVVFALILSAIPVIKLIHWAIDGEIEGGLVAVALVLYLGLLVSVMAGPNVVKIVALVLILGGALAFPLLGSAASAKQVEQMSDERLRSYVIALESNPNDPVARIALAQELEKRGDVEQAIEHLEWVLKEHPRLAFQHQRTLESWKRQLERRDTPDFFYCHMCHAEQLPGATHCAQCGAAFGTAEGMRERLYREGGPKAVIRGFVVTVLVVGLGTLALLELPSIVAGPIILGALIVGAVLFLGWVGGDIGKPAD